VPEAQDAVPPRAHSILSIERKGAGGEAVKIHLADGSFYVLHAEVFARSGISQGSSLDPDTLATLLARSERVFARRRALSLLSRAAHTRLGLARKLAKRGFSAPAVRHALARMAELGYLDDTAFAEAWLRTRLDARAHGWKALYRSMLGRGVPRAVADEVLDAMFPAELELEHALHLAAGLSPTAAIRKLSVRGFRSRAIAAVLRELKGKGRTGGEE
jgi:regulatory protein